MINVWSVCVGDKYDDEDVLILRDMVRRNLNQPHDFWCLSDRQIVDVNCLIPSEKWPGWWSKLLLFRYARGQILYLDLDVVVVGELDRLVSPCLAMSKNWAQSGHGGCQSSVMSWNTTVEKYHFLPDEFDLSQLRADGDIPWARYGSEGYWGDQEYITAKIGNPGDEIVPMQHIYSYKYHCMKKVPDDASVICFHGEPKPKDVQAQWVKNARLSTQTEV